MTPEATEGHIDMDDDLAGEMRTLTALFVGLALVCALLQGCTAYI